MELAITASRVLPITEERRDMPATDRPSFRCWYIVITSYSIHYTKLYEGYREWTKATKDKAGASELLSDSHGKTNHGLDSLMRNPDSVTVPHNLSWSFRAVQTYIRQKSEVYRQTQANNLVVLRYRKSEAPRGKSWGASLFRWFLYWEDLGIEEDKCRMKKAFLYGHAIFCISLWRGRRRKHLCRQLRKWHRL